MSKRAFITGITGQDGSYLTELLIGKGYEVHGLVRRTSLMQRGRIDALQLTPAQKKDRLFLHYGDLGESSTLVRLVHKIQPDEVYHLAGQSHVRVSFEEPEYTFDINASGTARLLECLRDFGKAVRFYNASTCEIFGQAGAAPQNELTPFRPVNPYACAKAASHFLTCCYRDCYGLFACNGILFNHESPRRGENFVTRKIARGAAAIKQGREKMLNLGSLDAKRDWGYAPEYVEAMWRMLQQKKPDDYVIATGEAHSVEDFVKEAFKVVDLDWRKHVKTDPGQIRPAEVPLLVGDASKAKRLLNWEAKVRFADLVRILVEAELQAAGA